MLEMANQEILPACIKYSNTVAKSVKLKKEVGIDSPNEIKLLQKLNELTEGLMDSVEKLQNAMDKIPEDIPESMEIKLAAYYRDDILPQMDSVRKYADSLELIVGKEYWPFPTYTDLLYKI